MKTAVIIIAICEVIRVVQITIDIIIGILTRKAAINSINKVGEGVTDELTPEKMMKALVKEVEKNDD